jgi:formate hydrogenlyase transcriptional activator
MRRPIESIPSAAIQALTAYDWPGNIRELQNLVERSVILSPGKSLQLVLPEPTKLPVASGANNRLDDSAERERILAALEECDGRVAGPHGAAARLGLRRTTLQSRMKKLGIERQYR